MRNAVFVAALALTLAGSSPTPPPGWPAVKKFFHDGVQQHGIAGGSLAWIANGGIAVHETAGVLDRASKIPVREDTIYHWASITKTFTAVAIMQLRDRGLLTLDDPIVDYVPELAAVHNPHGRMRDITIRHLLSHSAGFRGGTWPWGGNQPWHPFEPPGWEQLAAMMPYTEILFPPGSRYSYSNPGVVFLGRVIEKLSGEPFETYIDKEILRPLGMRDAFFDRAPSSLRARRSHSYEIGRDGQLVEQPFDFDSGITVSNGGLNAPITEMAKWMLFLMGSPSNDAVLRRPSLEEMWKPVVQVGDGSAGEAGVGVGAMGLSFFLETHGGLDFIAHSGTQNGFLSRFYIHMPTKTAYIVVFNTDAKTRAFEIALRDVIINNVWKAK